MSEQPTEQHADPLCPDCNKPFNPVRDFVSRFVKTDATLNVYRCPHCQHPIYKYTFPDGVEENAPDEPR